MFKQFIFIFILVLFVQGIFTYFQIKDFKKNADELRRLGRVSVGNKKGRMSAGAIVLFAADINGIVIAGRSMEGISVFAKFVPYDVYNGSKLTNVIADIEQKLETAQGVERARLTAALQSARNLLATYDNIKADEEVPIAEEAIEVQISETTDGENIFDEFAEFQEEQPPIVDIEEIKE